MTDFLRVWQWAIMQLHPRSSVVRGGRLTPEGIKRGNIGISGEGIDYRFSLRLFLRSPSFSASEGAYVILGMIDAHVYFNEPGRLTGRDFPAAPGP